MSDIRKAIMARLGEFARPGAKAEMANHIRTVAEDKEASRRGLRRMIDQLESEWQSLNNQPSKAGRIPRMETIKKQIAGLEERLKSLSSRPGAKAEMGRMLYSYEVDELEEFLDAYGVKDYDIITSIGQVKVPKSQVRKALDAISSLNREIRKEGIGGSVAVDVVPFSRPGAKATNALADACWEGYEAVGTKKQDGKTVPNCVPKATAAKPESQDIESEEVKAGLKLMEKADEKVSEKIRTLIKEGKPQDQAVAIALDMKRRGEL